MKAELVKNENNDLTVVNAARTSFDKQSELIEESGHKTISDRDCQLIQYLHRHVHWAPFAHARFTFQGQDPILKSIPHKSELRTGLVFEPSLKKVRHSFYGWAKLINAGYISNWAMSDLIHHLGNKMPRSSHAFQLDYEGNSSGKLSLVTDETDPRFIDVTMRETVPIFVARQRFKHTVDTDYNEISRRYVSYEPTFFAPEQWRSQPTNGAKQGSAGPLPNGIQDKLNAQLEAHHAQCLEIYNSMLKDGVAPEQARMTLPQSMFTAYWVTASLAAWKRAYTQRIDDHAQQEIQILAQQWNEILKQTNLAQWQV